MKCMKCRAGIGGTFGRKYNPYTGICSICERALIASGQQMPALPTHLQRHPKPGAKKWPWVALGLGVFSFALLVVAAVTKTNRERDERAFASVEMAQTNRRPDYSIDAWIACEDFVSRSLVSPATAKFSSLNVTELGSGRYRCKGWVDSQNRLGAMLRADFVLDVVLMGPNKWELSSEPTITPR